MHVQANKEQILKALELVVRISTKHQTLPVLQCVLISSDQKKNTVTFRTTNLELGIEVTIPARVEGEGVLAVPAALLMQTVQLFSDSDVTLRKEADILKLKGGTSNTNIKTFAHEEFPSIPHITGGGQELNREMFVLGIKTAAFAASQSSVKPELGSVYITSEKPHTLTCVATDSFRLVEKSVPQKGVSLDASIMVPARNALEIARVCELAESAPKLTVSENQIALSFAEGIYVTTRLTEGSFPDYTQIIPKEFATTATVLRGDLIHALKKTGIFTNTFLQVRAVVDPAAHAITLTAESGEYGTTEETVPATVDGKKLELSFNQRYLNDPLTLFTDDSIMLSFAGVGRPMVMNGVSDTSLRYLVMPMNR